MEVNLIAVIRGNGGVLGFRLLDPNAANPENKVMDIPINQVALAIRDGKIKVHGLKIEKGVLVGSNGSLDRYTTIKNGIIEGGKAPIVILGQIEINGNIEGYKVTDHIGTIKTFRTSDVIKYSKVNGIANGKVVKKDNSMFISSIVGNYPTESIMVEQRQEEPKKVEQSTEETRKEPIKVDATEPKQESKLAYETKDWVSLAEFKEYMDKKGYYYRVAETVHGYSGDIELELSEIDTRLEVLKIPREIDRLGNNAAWLKYRIKRMYVGKRCSKKAMVETLIHLEEVIYEEGITSINLGINSDKLKSVKLPSTLTKLRNYNLEDSIIDLSNTNIREIEHSFRYDGKPHQLQLSLPETLIRLEESIENVIIDHLELPPNLETIKASISGSIIKSVGTKNLRELQSLDLYSFYNVQELKEIDLSNSTKLAKIGREVISRLPDVEAVRLPDSVEVIADDTLKELPNIKEFNMPQGIQIIGENVLSKTAGLEIEIPQSIRTLGKHCFSSDTNLTIELGDGGEWGWDLPTINVSVNKLDIKTNAEVLQEEAIYNSEANELIINGPIKIIRDRAFKYMRTPILDLRNLDKLTFIGDKAFEYSDINRIVLPDGLIEVGASLIRGSQRLEAMVLPKTITKFGRGALTGSGAWQPTGTTFFVYEGSEAHKYCRRNKFSIELIDSIKDYDDYYAEPEGIELTDAEKAKFKLLLSGDEVRQKLLSDKYIGHAKKILQLSEVVETPYNKNFGVVELDKTKFIEFDIGNIPEMLEVKQRIVAERETHNDDETYETIFNTLANYITKTTGLDTRTLTTDALQYYRDKDVNIATINLYSYGNKSIMLEIYGDNRLMKKGSSSEYLTTILILDGDIINYVTNTFINIDHKDERVDFAILHDMRKENFSEIGAAISDYITSERTLICKEDYDKTTIDGSIVPKELNKAIYEATVDQWIIVHFKVIKHNMYGDATGLAEAKFMCALTGKIITANVRYSNYEYDGGGGQRLNDYKLIKVMELTSIQEFNELSREELVELAEFNIDTQYMEDTIQLFKQDTDRLKELREMDGAYEELEDLVTYEFRLSQILNKMKLGSLKELNETSYEAIVNTAYFHKTNRKMGRLLEMENRRVISTHGGQKIWVFTGVSRLRRNYSIINGGNLDSLVVLLEDREYSDQENLECYISHRGFNAIYKEILDIAGKEDVKNLDKININVDNTKYDKEDNQFKRITTTDIALEATTEKGRRLYRTIDLGLTIDRQYGIVSLMICGYRDKNLDQSSGNDMYKVFNFKSIQDGLKFFEKLAESREGKYDKGFETLCNDIVSEFTGLYIENSVEQYGDIKTEERVKNVWKLRKKIIDGYPNGYYIGGLEQVIYDLVAKQRPQH